MADVTLASIQARTSKRAARSLSNFLVFMAEAGLLGDLHIVRLREGDPAYEKTNSASGST